MRFNVKDNLGEFQYYQCPKELYLNEEYKDLSNDAKTLYMLMYDTNKLSVENNWIDLEGNFFIYFSLKKIEELLNIGTTKAVKIKKELVKKGLIEEIRQGLNKANIIYVNKLTFRIEKTGLSKNENPNFQNVKPNNNKENKNKNNNIDYKEIVDKYNSINEISKIIKLTDKRKKLLNARIKEYDLETVINVLDKVNSSEFLKGNNNRN